MKYKIADLSDIGGVLSLHVKYQLDSIAEEDKKDGFITAALTKEQLTSLIKPRKRLIYCCKR